MTTPVPPEHRDAAISALVDRAEMIASCGRHEGHALSRAGRCVYCSCGSRYQGRMPTDADREEMREICEEYRAEQERREARGD